MGVPRSEGTVARFKSLSKDKKVKAEVRKSLIIGRWLQARAMHNREAEEMIQEAVSSLEDPYDVALFAEFGWQDRSRDVGQ